MPTQRRRPTSLSTRRGKSAATLDQAVAQAGRARTVGSGIADFGKNAWAVLSSNQLHEFAKDVIEFSTEFVGEFAKAETSTARLTQALKDSGQASPAVAKAYDDMARSLQKISTFSHVAITDAQAIFTTIGQVGPENMEKTLLAAMNLAAFMQTDVPAAAKLMQKAAESNGEALGKLKVLLGDAYTKGMDFNQIVDALTKKFDGQFTAALNTTAGALANMKNKVSDANEELGKMQSESLRGLLDAFNKLPDGVQNFLIKAYQITESLEAPMASLGALAQLAGVLFPEAMVAAGEAIVAVVGAFVGWPAVITAAVIALGVAIYKYWDQIIAYLKNAVATIGAFLTVDLPKAFDDSVQTVAKWYYGVKFWLQDQFGALVDWVVNKIPEVTAAFRLAAEAIVFHSIVPEMIAGIGSEFAKLQSVMVDPRSRRSRP